MKKNISINISGIIFHIEEDGYDALRKYLDSINSYFGSFKDSSEILADIEGRIAEIFLSKLNEEKQVITWEDVQSLIATMGNVSDFKAAEEPDTSEESFKNQSGTQQNYSSGSVPPPIHKKLFRDERRKIVGGVCAGLGYYFGIDPVWPRVLFALLVLGSYGGLILVYIILWIVLPSSSNLKDEPAVKKMYRNPEKKVLGGVAGGIAAFFGTDVTVIRLLFVILTLVGGFGFVLYVILWIALPIANSITEKMEMQGEPVTLSNIETTIKKHLNEKEEEESTLAKMVLFPFRLIATIITALSKVIEPIAKLFFEFIRIVIGLALLLIGFALLFAIVITFGIFVGVFGTSLLPDYWGGNINELHFPIEAIRNTFPIWSMVAAFVVAFIPVLVILLSGSSILAKRSFLKPTVAWSLAALFFIAVLVISFTIPKIIYSFMEEGEYKTEQVYSLPYKTIVLNINEAGFEDYSTVHLTIKGYEGKDVKLIQRFQAQGYSQKNGVENAQMVEYHVAQQDSTLTFDSNLTFKKDAKFRAQRLEMDLYLPYGKLFVIDEYVWRIIDNNDRDYDGYYDSNFNKTWKMTENGFECINCQQPTVRKSLQMKDQYGYTDFNEIELTGIFDLSILQADEFSVRLDGPENEKKKYNVSLSDETLDIRYRSRNNSFWENNVNMDDKVKIQITMPHLRKLKIKGVGEFTIRNFDEEEMDIFLIGAMNGEADIQSHKLRIDMSGPMTFQLDGSGHFLQAEVRKLAQLKASQYEIENAEIEAREMGNARVNASNSLEIDTDVVSKVKYQGNPEIIKRD